MTVKKLVVGYSDICANARRWSSRRFIGVLAATVAGSLGISVAVAETPAPNKAPNNATEQRADLSARYSIRYLVQLYQGATYLSPLAKDADERPYKDAARNAALAYVAGVIDSAERIRWCVNQSSLPPREVDQLTFAVAEVRLAEWGAGEHYGASALGSRSGRSAAAGLRR